MDGADEKWGVVLIVATNHHDQIDPVLLRAGRFTQKVGFKAVELSEGMDDFDFGDLLAVQTTANMAGCPALHIDQRHLEAPRTSAIKLTTGYINAALGVVLGQQHRRQIGTE